MVKCGFYFFICCSAIIVNTNMCNILSGKIKKAHFNNKLEIFSAVIIDNMQAIKDNNKKTIL